MVEKKISSKISKSVADKLKEEYDRKGLFSFLKKHALGNKKTKEYAIEGSYLPSFFYVLEHPGSDLEKNYVKETIHFHTNKELDFFLQKNKDKQISLEDSENNFIFTNKKNNYKKAKVFRSNTEKEYCYSRKSITIKDYLMGVNIIKQMSTSIVNIDVTK